MTEALTIRADRERAWRRWVAISAALHAVLLLVSTLALDFFPRDVEPPAGDPFVLVTPQELAAMMSPERPAAAPRPAKPNPEPVVQPEPEPPTPKPEEVIIPEDAARKPVKKQPEVETARPDPPPRPSSESQEQQSLEDLLFAQRLEVGSMPTGPTRQAMPRPGAGGTGDAIDAELAAWHNRVRQHTRRRWQPAQYRGKKLSAKFLITLTSSGAILDYELDQSSGNPWFDESVERYLARETELPPPPRGGEYPIIFDGDF